MRLFSPKTYHQIYLRKLNIKVYVR